MTFNISTRPIPVLIDGHDSEGRLVLADGQLVAVIVLLDGQHHSPEEKGRWHLEAGFGKCTPHPAGDPLWNTPEEAGMWIQNKLTGHSPHA
jgi:hypothetical protein